MMNGHHPVSANEQRILFSITFFCFAMRIYPIIMSFLVDPAPGPNFGLYSIYEHKDIMGPIYSFPVFLLCSLLAIKVDIPWSTISVLLLLPLSVFFDWWFVETRVRIAEAARVNPGFQFNQLKTVDFALLGGSILDVLTLLLVNLLLIWNLTILVRLVRNER